MEVSIDQTREDDFLTMVDERLIVGDRHRFSRANRLDISTLCNSNMHVLDWVVAPTIDESATS